MKNRTRLYDRKLDTLPKSNCFIPFNDQLNYLEKTLEVAKQAVWVHFQEHWPQIFKAWFPESHRQVRFGFSEIQEMFECRRWLQDLVPTECGGPGEMVREAIYDVSTRRNKICHAGTVYDFPSVMDTDMKRAQNLAVVLQDEPRANAIRNLRDQLFTDALNAHQEIAEACSEDDVLKPAAYKTHHQQLFWRMTDDYDYTPAKVSYSDQVIWAAREWCKTHRFPGDDENLPHSNLSEVLDVLVPPPRSKWRSKDDE